MYSFIFTEYVVVVNSLVLTFYFIYCTIKNIIWEVYVMFEKEWPTVSNSFYHYLYFAQSFNQTRLLLLPCHVRMINHSSITLQNGLQTPCFSLPCWVNKKLLLCNLGHHLQTIFCLPHPTIP